MQDAESHDVVTLENQITERYGLLISQTQLAELHAKIRSGIIPGRPLTVNDTSDDLDGAHHHSASARMSWARLLKRVFDIDVQHCPQCGGTLKIIAAIEDPSVIARILAHLGLPTRAPPRPPAQTIVFETT